MSTKQPSTKRDFHIPVVAMGQYPCRALARSRVKATRTYLPLSHHHLRSSTANRAPKCASDRPFQRQRRISKAASNDAGAIWTRQGLVPVGRELTWRNRIPDRRLPSQGAATATSKGADQIWPANPSARPTTLRTGISQTPHLLVKVNSTPQKGGEMWSLV